MIGRRRCPALLLLALLGGCGKDGERTSDGAPVSAVASAAPSTAASAQVSAAPLPPPPPACRALDVSGQGSVGERALASGQQLDGEAWVSLEKDAAVTLMHSASGRELKIAGPARFRACRRGREQLLLAKGVVTAGASTGARPGAEVLIATPVATLRYGDADFTLSLDDKRLTASVRAGRVAVDAVPPAKPLKSPLNARDRLQLPLGKPDAGALMSRCKEAAEAAESAARQVVDAEAKQPLGERARDHVKARKSARLACTVAAAATGLVADPAASAGLWADVVRWEGLLESVPRRGHGSTPEK